MTIHKRFIGPLLASFKSPPTSLQHDVPHSVLRMGWIACALGLIASTLWLYLAPVSGAIVAEGIVKTEGNRKTVQHQEGGIIKTILVKDGDRVKAGDALVTLTDIRTDAMLSSLSRQATALTLKADRLRAERDFLDQPTFKLNSTALLVSEGQAHVEELTRAETSLFQARRQSLTWQMRLLQRQLHEVDQEMHILAGLLETTRSSQALAEEAIRMNERLNTQGFISQARWMELRRTDYDSRARSQSEEADLARTRQKKTDLELRIAALRIDYTKSAAAELKESEDLFRRVEQDIRPLLDLKARQTITAPVAGEIVDLRFHGAGTVIGPRDAVLDIVPDEAPLIIETHINPENIKDIQVGGHADVFPTAYKHGSAPPLGGVVTYLGADRLTDRGNGHAYYLARIRIPPEALKQASAKVGRHIELLAGMQAEVLIKTQSRTPLGYLMDPLLSGIRRSMRER